MRVLIVNPVVYTSENQNIKRASSIKDTMIYDLCIAFKELGHQVCLYAAKPFKPLKEEEYPFSIVWGECVWQKLFMPHCLPFMPSLYKYIRKNITEIDLIICSEVFSMNSLIAVLAANKKTIIWHELAKHNRIMKKIPSLIWYNIIARFFMRNTKIIARSPEAQRFIGRYCKNTQKKIVDHGVNLSKFKITRTKKKQFIVCSQLISRKRIDDIIRSFAQFLKKYDANYMLYIIGDGDKKQELEALVQVLQIDDNVVFKGKMTHSQLMPYLSDSQALLINTEKDNNMISIIEAIAVGTPILTTDVPLNAAYIKKYELGVVSKWNEDDLQAIVINNKRYIENCICYRKTLSTTSKAEAFLAEIK